MGSHSSHSSQSGTPPRAWSAAVPLMLVASALAVSGSFSPAVSQPVKPKAAPLAKAETSARLNRAVLKPGSQGSEVSELQAMLKLLGYYNATVDGIYSEGTANAVQAFQKAAGIGADGIAGAETWNRLLPAAPAIAASSSPAPKPPTETAPPPKSTAPPPTAQKPTPVAQQPDTTPDKPSTPDKPTSSSPAQVATLPVLKIGMQGSAVAGLQERLRSLGFLKGAADGVFGSETDAAVKAAQRNFSLEADGVVGTSTWIAILK
jgi:N-acetylmuramoyl-L-alanine amidase